VHVSVALDLYFEPLGERVRDRYAHAVQAARELVGGVRFGARELRAGVEFRQDQLDRGDFFLGMQADGDPAAVVGDRHRAITVHGDVDAVGVAAERLVGRVVYRFLDDVGGIRGPGIHPRQPLHRLYAPELLD